MYRTYISLKHRMYPCSILAPRGRLLQVLQPLPHVLRDIDAVMPHLSSVRNMQMYTLHFVHTSYSLPTLHYTD